MKKPVAVVAAGFFILTSEIGFAEQKDLRDDNMYFHALQTENIKNLKPKISNHNIPLIYFSDKRENVLVYLSNTAEKSLQKRTFCI